LSDKSEIKAASARSVTPERAKQIMDKYPKMLVTYPGRCTGCGRCTLHCSFAHEKVNNPLKARIHVVRYEPYVDSPVVCWQCGICISSCPIGVIKRNRSTGAVVIDEKKCNGCGQCQLVCPIGAITMDPSRLVALKCDLCNGDPACVKGCPYNALGFEKPENGAYYRRLESALVLGRKELG